MGCKDVKFSMVILYRMVLDHRLIIVAYEHIPIPSCVTKLSISALNPVTTKHMDNSAEGTISVNNIYMIMKKKVNARP